MPKRHHKHSSIRPISTPHPSLTSNPRAQHGQTPATPATPAADASVNELINRVRRTQVSGDQPRSVETTFVTRSVHPSLRNLLDVPQTPPPRPRSDSTIWHTGLARLRRTPGPPPPMSWLTDSVYAAKDRVEQESTTSRLRKAICAALPGAAIPASGSLQDFVLKAMAKHWQWHLEYDNAFLGELPTQVKDILLTYVAVHHDNTVRTPRGGANLGYIFPEKLAHHPRGPTDHSNPKFDPLSGLEVVENISTYEDVRRLDLSFALGSWVNMKQVHRDLVRGLPDSARRESVIENEVSDPSQSEVVLSSWEEAFDPIGPNIFASPTPYLRFPNLTHLSLALSNTSTAPTWSALLKLTSHLSTLSHLSLAHWPVPTLTPNALASNAFVRNPVSSALPRISYSGTDSYAELDNEWIEAAGLLKRLSQHLYCLKWLDLTGCGDWFAALGGPRGGKEVLDPTEPTHPRGPEWNGAWRGVKWVGLGVGWAPRKWNDENDLESMPDSTASDALGWDVEVERRRHYLEKEVKDYWDIREKAKRVAKQIQDRRRSGNGGWIDFDFGGSV